MEMSRSATTGDSCKLSGVRADTTKLQIHEFQAIAQLIVCRIMLIIHNGSVGFDVNLFKKV